MKLSEEQLEKREKEVLWFKRKYLSGDKQNFELLMKHLSPWNVTKILRRAVAEEMVLTWEEDISD